MNCFYKAFLCIELEKRCILIMATVLGYYSRPRQLSQKDARAVHLYQTKVRKLLGKPATHNVNPQIVSQIQKYNVRASDEKEKERETLDIVPESILVTFKAVPEASMLWIGLLYAVDDRQRVQTQFVLTQDPFMITNTSTDHQERKQAYQGMMEASKRGVKYGSTARKRHWVIARMIGPWENVNRASSVLSWLRKRTGGLSVRSDAIARVAGAYRKTLFSDTKCDLYKYAVSLTKATRKRN